jgi:hypothetical protein
MFDSSLDATGGTLSQLLSLTDEEGRRQGPLQKGISTAGCPRFQPPPTVELTRQESHFFTFGRVGGCHRARAR